jgi:hypothetical protein
MSYTPPAYNAIDLSFVGEIAYTPPAYNAIDFVFQTTYSAALASAYVPEVVIAGGHGVAASLASSYSPQALFSATHAVAAVLATTYAPSGAFTAHHTAGAESELASIYVPIASFSAAHGVAALLSASYAPAAAFSATHAIGGGLTSGYAPAAAFIGRHENLFTGIEDGFRTVTAPLRLTVRGTGDVTAPLRLNGALPHGDVIAPLRLKVRGAGDVTAPLRLTVLGSSLRWKHQVLLAGVDVSARVTGEVWDEQNEGAAHLAGFTLLPAGGTINPFSYVGAAVVINHIRRETSGNIAQRRFSGKVHQPDYNPVSGTITFTCTDDFQIRVSQLSRAVLDQLTGGRYHRAVHGEPENNWEYAQKLMETIPASLDCTPEGAITVTPWQGLAVHKIFNLSNTVDGSIKVTLPQRTSIINQITATFQYRFTRLYRRTAHIRYNMQLSDAVNNALPLLARSTVEAALSSTGWEFFYQRGEGSIGGGGSSYIGPRLADSDPVTPVIHYTPYPAVYEYPFSDALWFQNESDTTCMGFSCSMYRRWAQTVTETYTLTVKAPESISQNGILAREDSASLASEWEASAWESDVNAEPQLDSSARFQILDYAPDADSDDRDDAIETYVDTLKVRLQSTHRTGQAGATVLMDPSINLTRAERIETERVTAEGKVVYVRHSSNADADAGYALTEFRIAISGHGATGLPEVDETVTAPPTAPTASAISDALKPQYALNLGVHIGGLATSPDEQDDWQGWTVNVQSSVKVTDPGADSYSIEGEVQKETGYSGDWTNPNFVAEKAYENTGFRIVLPAVEDDARNNQSPSVSKTYEIPIPENDFELAA